jgi:hypothetical protein
MATVSRPAFDRRGRSERAIVTASGRRLPGRPRSRRLAGSGLAVARGLSIRMGTSSQAWEGDSRGRERLLQALGGRFASAGEPLASVGGRFASAGEPLAGARERFASGGEPLADVRDGFGAAGASSGTTFPARATRRASNSLASWATTSNRPACVAQRATPTAGNGSPKADAHECAIARFVTSIIQRTGFAKSKYVVTPREVYAFSGPASNVA